MNIIEYAMKKIGTKEIKDLDGLTLDLGKVWINFYYVDSEIVYEVVE